MYNNRLGGSGTPRRQTIQRPEAKPSFVTPNALYEPTLDVARIAVWTSSFTADNGHEVQAYNTTDLGFNVRVSSFYQADENGVITYDPKHATLNFNGKSMCLYIFESPRLKDLSRAERMQQVEQAEVYDDYPIPTDEDAPPYEE